jgi:tetraacyldisaccharide-1-P 4'-kinase
LKTDLLSIESTKKYNGLYFILGGTLATMRKEDISNLRIEELKKRISENNFSEIIIVSKFKPTISKQEDELIKKAIAPKAHQTVFFSTMAYASPIPVFGSNQTLTRNTQILAFSSIAKPEPFFNYLKEQFAVVKHKSYPDHHLLNDREIIDLTERFELLEGQDKAIITTVKDRSKLLSLELPESFKQLPLFSLSISPVILFEEENSFSASGSFSIIFLKTDKGKILLAITAI